MSHKKFAGRKRIDSILSLKKIKAKITPAITRTVQTEHLHSTPFPIKLTEGDGGDIRVPNRVQLFRTGTFRKLLPTGGSQEIKITEETLAEIVKNFKNHVRGVEPAIDFAHRSDDEAAAWIKDLKIEQVGGETQLWAEVDWTPDGKAAVAAKRFRYLSPDFAFSYTDNETGEKFGATLFGAGLTNRPVIKNMAPAVELTEVEDMAKGKKKIQEMSAEELKVLLAETKDETAKSLIQWRLDEMADDVDGGDDDSSDDDDASDDGDDKEDGKAKDKKFSDLKKAHAKLSGDYQKMAKEMADMKSSMLKSLSEAKDAKKVSDFEKLVLGGKAVEAQREAFLCDDMIKFSELAQPVKLETFGATGAPIGTETSAQDEILKLAEEKRAKNKDLDHGTSISMVLNEKPELNRRYQKEIGVL